MKIGKWLLPVVLVAAEVRARNDVRVVALLLVDGKDVLHAAFTEYFAFAEVVADFSGGVFGFPVVTGLAGGFHNWMYCS